MTDWRRLKEEADIHQVIDALGIPAVQRGSNYFIHCPNPDHNDRHATNCYFKDGWDGVKCMVCGKYYKSIDIIMWTLGCSDWDAAQWLWHLEGEPDWFTEDEKNHKNGKRHFILSKAESELIGIHQNGTVLMPVCNVGFKDRQLEQKMAEEAEAFDGKKHRFRYTAYSSPEIHKYGPGIEAERDFRTPLPEEGYVLMEEKVVSFKDFMDEKEWLSLVCRKSKEAMAEYFMVDDYERADRCRKLWQNARKFYQYA